LIFLETHAGLRSRKGAEARALPATIAGIEDTIRALDAVVPGHEAVDVVDRMIGVLLAAVAALPAATDLEITTGSCVQNYQIDVLHADTADISR
jgi:hypothetical protein